MDDPDSVVSQIDLTQPKMTYAGPIPSDDPTPPFLFSEMMSEHPSAKRVLDLGCGRGNKRECFEFLGCDYVGIDPFGSFADINGDAHFLPFRDHQFDVVFSYAVFEHLYNPFAAISEVRRVLKPDGIFIGMVSQGEPFHSSYFHHTSWGYYHSAMQPGFE
jgi:SAM-dependent methyltransferase